MPASLLRRKTSGSTRCLPRSVSRFGSYSNVAYGRSCSRLSNNLVASDLLSGSQRLPAVSQRVRVTKQLLPVKQRSAKAKKMTMTSMTNGSEDYGRSMGTIRFVIAWCSVPLDLLV